MLWKCKKCGWTGRTEELVTLSPEKEDCPDCYGDAFEAWCNDNGYQDVTGSEPGTVNLDRLHQAIEVYNQAVKPAQAVEASENSPF